MSDPAGRASRRRLLVRATTTAGAAGAVVAAVPFLRALRPSRRALAVGGPVVVDPSGIEPGEQLTVKWRGKPVWVLKRTRQMLATLLEVRPRLRDPDSEVATQQPSYARNQWRSRRPEHFVCIGICTHLGCVPTFRPEVAPPDLGPEWRGGYFCPCHGSMFDLAGRVFRDVPAPTNLVVPPYRYALNGHIVVGEDVT